MNEERENGEKKRTKIEKPKVENWKLKEETIHFFLFTFQNHWNLFWVYENGNYTGKKHFTPGKKSGKMTLSPLKQSRGLAERGQEEEEENERH